MPLTAALQPLITSRQFWREFFWINDAEGNYPELKDCKVELPIAGFGLTLELDDSVGYFSLNLRHPSGEIQIAWDDQAHWHPHVLRWEELELIARAIAIQDPALPHPGVVLQLLQRFTPLCDDDDTGLIVPMLETAWRNVPDLSEQDAHQFLEQIDCRGNGFEWCHDETVGWCLEQDEEEAGPAQLYTLRHSENDEFPFAAWREMVATARVVLDDAANRVAAVRLDFLGPEEATEVIAEHHRLDLFEKFAETGSEDFIPQMARALRDAGDDVLADRLDQNPDLTETCWIAETVLRADFGEIVKRHVTSEWRPREQHSLTLDIPLRDEKRPLPDLAGKVICGTLRGLLSDLGIGDAGASGGMSEPGPDGKMIETQVSLYVQIQGELETGKDVLRQVLWWLGAPSSVQLHCMWQEYFPLDLERPPQSLAPCYLELIKPKIAKTKRLRQPVEYWIHRDPLGVRLCKAIVKTLSAAGATDPDDNGWSQLALADGGRMRVCTGHTAERYERDRVTFAIENMTPSITDMIFELAADHGFIILPLGLAPSQNIVEALRIPPPCPLRVVDSEALHETLSAGAYANWTERGAE